MSTPAPGAPPGTLPTAGRAPSGRVIGTKTGGVARGAVTVRDWYVNQGSGRQVAVILILSILFAQLVLNGKLGMLWQVMTTYHPLGMAATPANNLVDAVHSGPAGQRTSATGAKTVTGG